MPAKQFTAFISYAHTDGEEMAATLLKKIRAHKRGKSITFWQDCSEMKYGQWSKQIEEAIDAVEFLIMLITPGALASPNCKDEWMHARKKGIAVLPVNGKPGDPDFYNNFPNWLKKQHIYHPEKNWERFINDLNSSPETPKVPFMAPRLSEVSNYVERTGKLQRLKNLLLHADEPVAITTALQGSGGFGKTILAIALCNDDEIINSFIDGILWVTLGQQKDTALTAIQKLYDAISNNNNNFLDIEQAQQYLSEKLTGRNYLLVLDDVWHRIDAENILKPAGKCTVLITTRMDKMLENAKQEHVDEMTKDEAVAQLSNFTGTGNAAHNELAALAEKLGHWALLLRLTGAQLKARIDEGETLEKAIAFVNKRLERKGLFSFDKTDAAQRNDSVAICLTASIDLLNNEDQQKLYSLGIFPEDENIPYAVLEKYWGLDDFDCEELLEKFHRHGLIDLDVPGRTVKMHDILLKYYSTCLQGKPARHILLIKRLGSFDTWKDKYAWQWCIWHLIEAGSFEQAVQLLADYDWIEAKLTAAGNLYDVASDYDLVPFSEGIKLIQKALVLSAPIIAEDPAQLPQQLYGRLGLLEHTQCKQLAIRASEAIGEKQPALKSPLPNLEIPDLHNLVFRGHTSYVYGALIQGNILISWSDDKTLRSWDIRSGKTLHVFEGHSSSVEGALMQGSSLVSWSNDKTLRLWDINSGEIKMIFEGHSSGISGVLQRKNTLISWSNEEALLISWDILSGKIKKVFEGHTNSVCGALIQDEILISWSNDNTLRSWDVVSGKNKRVFEGHSGSVYGALIQDDRLISWSDDNTLRSWDILSGKPKQVFEGHTGLNCRAVIRGDTLISLSNEKTLRSWDIPSGKQKQVFEGHEAIVWGASIQGDTLISWSYDKTLRSWDFSSGKNKQVFEGHTDLIFDTLIYGDTLISWSNDKTLRSWDIATGKEKQVFGGHTGSVHGALIQGDTLISWSNDKTLRSWNIGSEKVEQALDKHAGLIRGALTYGDTLFTWCKDKTLLAWDILSGNVKQVFEGHIGLVEGALAHGSRLISWSDDKTLRSWDITSGSIMQIFEGHTDSIKGASIQGDTLISWSSFTLLMWDIHSRKTKLIFEGLFDLLLIQDGTLITYYSDHLTLGAWDIHSGKMKQVFKGHAHLIKNALIQDDTLISWSDDKMLRSWDMASGKSKQVFEGHTESVIGMLIHSDTLISWSKDQTLRAWDWHSGKIKKVFKGHSSQINLAFIQDNMLISIGTNELLIWDLSTADVIKRLDSKRATQFQIHKGFLFFVDNLNTVWIYKFSGHYICRFTIDADITTLQIAENMNRIILGDASGRIHFLEPVGFHV